MKEKQANRGRRSIHKLVARKLEEEEKEMKRHGTKYLTENEALAKFRKSGATRCPA
jgi:hypothetical protein